MENEWETIEPDYVVKEGDVIQCIACRDSTEWMGCSGILGKPLSFNFFKKAEGLVFRRKKPATKPASEVNWKRFDYGVKPNKDEFWLGTKYNISKGCFDRPEFMGEFKGSTVGFTHFVTIPALPIPEKEEWRTAWEKSGVQFPSAYHDEARAIFKAGYLAGKESK